VAPLPDAHSDHDLFVVTRAGAQERFRTELGWLPERGAIAMAFRETAHGVKVLYAGGHLVEFAAFDLEELAVARVNRYRVALDRADVAARMERIARITADETAAAPPDLTWHAGQFLTNLVVGAGRDARGERLSGHSFVRVHAVRHLAVLLRTKLPAERAARLDNLDPYRRFEQVCPDLGRELEAALVLPVPAAARALLGIAARELPELVASAAHRAVARVLDGEPTTTG
jgi:hypothetical protein